MRTRGLVLMAGILLVTLACGLGTPAPTPVDTQPGVETIVAGTLQAMTSVAPPPTEVVQPSGTNVSFRNVSFVIPTGLATDANSEAVPAILNEQESAPWDIAPEHIVFTLNGYSISYGSASAPTIKVIPAQEYSSVNAGGSQSIPALQALLADPAAPLTVDSIPGVPYYNAAQIMAAQSARLNFQSGSGVRTIAHYGQFPGPITKTGQFYYFQGLTSDGKYYVIATLPIISPLQSTEQNPSADGPTYPDPNTIANPSAYEMYYPAMAEILDAASPESFSPTLNQIDALMQSITIASQ
ncbi:MAG: hypothetical protein AB1649_28655 [Chloroflexota bacterium]